MALDSEGGNVDNNLLMALCGICRYFNISNKVKLNDSKYMETKNLDV